jgi:hypothetical protein
MSNEKLAVLIDADNAQPSVIKGLLAEVATHGVSSVKRAYGDWTSPNLKGWKEVLHLWAIQPIQQFSYTSGKNSTDSSLIIDAMDLLHAGKLDGFCLVSSDSDFTRLATRIRESGLLVYGFGEKKTPDAFVAACDKFVYTEILRPSTQIVTEIPEMESRDPVDLGNMEPMLRNAITMAAREDGLSSLSNVGNLLSKNSPSFDSRNYGCQRLSELMRRLPFVEVKEVQNDKSGVFHTFVKLINFTPVAIAKKTKK